MDIEREILNLKEYDLIPLIDDYWNERDEYWDENENGDLVLNISAQCNYELIETILDYYDLEDGYEVNNHIIKRLSDGKYFKFYSKYVYSEQIVIPNQEIKEVFPKEKTIIVYE